MSTTSQATNYLKSELGRIREETGVPALAAALARNDGSIVHVTLGIRKNDVSADLAANRSRAGDRFSMGSVSKPMTGYLIAHLVQLGRMRWDMKIADVFGEFRNAACRSRYGVRSDYLDCTVEQLMAHATGLLYAPTNGFEMQGFDTNQIPGYATETSAVGRRYQYLVAAMQDQPGEIGVYSGGSVIVTAMAERLLQRSYESLMRDMVFGPLGMSQSSVGRLATTATPNGTWQHSWAATSGAISPNTGTVLPAFDWHSHNPAGAVACSARDTALFLRANLSRSSAAKPVVANAGLRRMQDTEVRPRWTSGGWQSNGEQGNDRRINHNGDNGCSRADMHIWAGLGYGYAAMSNVSDPHFKETDPNPGRIAVNRCMAILRTMNRDWAELFPT